MRRSAVLSALFLLASASDARAEPLADGTNVTVAVDVEGPVRVESAGGTTSCSGPCNVVVPAGFVYVRTERASRELYIEASSRVVLTPGTPGLRTAGAIALVAGIVVVAAAVAVPLLVCRRGPYRLDASGRQVADPSPCEGLDDGVKAAWIGGAGVGLTAAIGGGIVFALSGPQLRLVDDAPRPQPPREEQATKLRLTPWAGRLFSLPATVAAGGRPVDGSGPTAGLALTVTF